MKRLIIIFFFICTPLYAEKIERLGFYNLQEILEDDTLTYKIIKGCMSLNSAVTEIIKEEHPDLANEFFKSANYLYPFGILVLKKIKKTTRENAQKEFFFDVDSLTKDYMSFMRQNGVINQRSKLIIKTNEYIKSLNVPSVNTIIGNRQIYASSMGEGKTAIEKQRKGAATEEIKKLSEQILSELN